MTRLLKILPRAAWAEIEASGRFAGCGIDLADGYIHFSTEAQVGETARRHFAGQRDLVVFEVDADDVTGEVRWEASRGGELFPHLYGVVERHQLRAVRDAPLDADGVPRVIDVPPVAAR